MTVEWTVGDVIRRLRTLAGWTLPQLKALTGVSSQAINKIELGHTLDPRRQTLDSIASAFGLNERQLRNAVPPPMDLPVRYSSGT